MENLIVSIYSHLVAYLCPIQVQRAPEQTSNFNYMICYTNKVEALVTLEPSVNPFGRVPDQHKIKREQIFIGT